MGWAWADEHTHRYGGAPGGTIYLGTLAGILHALRCHTDRRRLAIKTDCLQAIAAIEAARSGRMPTTPAGRKNFPLIQAVLDEVKRHGASVSFHAIDEETPVSPLKTARLFAQQQLQLFTDSPDHAPVEIPQEALDVMIRRRLLPEAVMAQCGTQDATRSGADTTHHIAISRVAAADTTAGNANRNAGKTDAGSTGKTPKPAVQATAPQPHAAQSPRQSTVPAPPRPRHAAADEVTTDEEQASRMLELLHSTVRNLHSSAQALRATADAYDSALKHAKNAQPGIDGNPITPLSEKPLRKARKHTKAAALEYEKAAEELEAFIAGSADVAKAGNTRGNAHDNARTRTDGNTDTAHHTDDAAHADAASAARWNR